MSKLVREEQFSKEIITIVMEFMSEHGYEAGLSVMAITGGAFKGIINYFENAPAEVEIDKEIVAACQKAFEMALGNVSAFISFEKVEPDDEEKPTVH